VEGGCPQPPPGDGLREEDSRLGCPRLMRGTPVFRSRPYFGDGDKRQQNRANVPAVSRVPRPPMFRERDLALSYVL